LGPSQRRRSLVLICILAVACVVVYFPSEVRIDANRTALGDVLRNIPDWKPMEIVPMREEVVRELQLDDYVHRSYTNARDVVTLYVGYYFSNKKVGAAHDPMVCFPGQGWMPSNLQRGTIALKGLAAGEIRYSSMVVQQDLRRDYILYWFQSFDRSCNNTFAQKITLIWGRLLRRRGDNAFVRIAVNVGQKSPDECRDVAISFVNSFYPVMLSYIIDPPRAGE